MTIFLKKVKAGEKWDSLDKKKALVFFYYLIFQVKEPAQREEKDPTGGLMDMMKEMYQNVIFFLEIFYFQGDDSMKKIIAESFSKANTEQKDNFDLNGLE